MSETPPVQDHQTEDVPQAAPVARRKRMFDDPVVRRMAYAAVSIVVLFLVTVLSVLATGVIAPSGPRTLSEKELAITGAAVSAGTTETADWGHHISALIAAGQHSRAQSVIKQARASLNDSSSAEFDLAEARLLLARKKYEPAIQAADLTMERIETNWNEVSSGAGLVAQRAKIDGFHRNYYTALLVKAEAYEGLGEWDSAVSQYDIYIERFRGAADILIDRGNAKEQAGDKAGAEADYREAQRFMPESPEAQEALERIGATQ